MAEPAYQSYAQLCQFLKTSGRLPWLSDPIPAYRYAGWALPMIWEGHRILPNVPDRWGYHLHILQTRRIPDAPIPHIEFLGGPHQETLKHLHQWVALAAEHQSNWTGLTNLIAWIAFSLNISHTPPPLDDVTQSNLYQSVNLQELVLHPYDYWGDIIAEGIGNGPWANPNAFYPTPMSICQLLTRMILPDTHGLSREELKSLRVKKISDPAGSGTGRMLLLASNISLALYGVEKDALVWTASLINGALYAPWLTFPIPDCILREADSEHQEGVASTEAVATPGIETGADTTGNGHHVEPDALQLVLPGY